MLKELLFSLEYDTTKFFHRIFGSEEEANTFINSFKDIEEAKEFLECFENKDKAKEYLANCSDEKEITEHRIQFNENKRRREIDGQCGEDCFWKLKDKTLFIEGSGKMKDYNWHYGTPTTPWSSKREQIENVVIGEGITTIGGYAFCYCSSLTSITIPDGVTTIGERAFDGDYLRTATLPKRFENQKDSIFFCCKQLQNINWI